MSEIKRLSECDSPGMVDDPDGDYVTYSDHLAAVEAAVMAEREACAATSDAYAKEIYFYSNESQAVEVAKRIRARTTKPAEEAK